MSLRRQSARQIATWFGCGRVSVGPGTAGSFGAIPLHLLLSLLGPVAHTAVVVAVSAVGIWAAGEHAAELGEKDPQSIVIDEVAGTLIALGLVRSRGPAALIAAFVLFRVLDIAKPGPIERAQHAPGGLGIMADDFLAGFAAGTLSRWLIRR
jgi:phosphatidylglycerophosphatase A